MRDTGFQHVSSQVGTASSTISLPRGPAGGATNKHARDALWMTASAPSSDRSSKPSAGSARTTPFRTLNSTPGSGSTGAPVAEKRSWQEPSDDYPPDGRWPAQKRRPQYRRHTQLRVGKLSARLTTRHGLKGSVCFVATTFVLLPVFQVGLREHHRIRVRR
ncbi:hypothetical protein MRX96_035176 [Rhipicephalus microplus]